MHSKIFHNIGSYLFRIFVIVAFLLAQAPVSNAQTQIDDPKETISIQGALQTNDVFENCATQTEIPTEECEALTALFTATNEEDWTESAGWLVTYTPCSWFGVGCQDGHVTTLELAENQLAGEIPPELGGLTALEKLDLHDNPLLTGSLPADLTLLTDLKELDFSGTNLCMPGDEVFQSWLAIIPVQSVTEICRLMNPQLLMEVHGPIPSTNLEETEEISETSTPSVTPTPSETPAPSETSAPFETLQPSATMPNPEDLLPGDSLSGIDILAFCSTVTEIPVEECTAIIDLYVTDDGANWENLNGWLTNNQPCSWYGITCVDGHVQRVSLPENRLTGTIPSSITNVSFLEELNLFGNSLIGDIPAGLWAMTSLQNLRLSSNSLTGALPTELGNLQQLTVLDLSGNQLQGDLPNQLGSLLQLTELSLGGNQFTGMIPVELGNLTGLRRLALEYNLMSGGIPTELGNLKNLELLSFGNNAFSGILPESLLQVTQLIYLGFSATSLCYPHTQEFLEWISSIPYADISSACPTVPFTDCSLINGISVSECETLSAFYTATQGDTWTIRTNWMETDSPCYWFGVGCSEGHVISLDLPGNNLVGSVPASLGNLTWINSLNISSNPLTDSLPLELVNLTNLQEFHFADTSVCMPTDEAFQNWITAIPSKSVTKNCVGPFTSCETIKGISIFECFFLNGLFQNGSTWINKDGWFVTDDPCSWYGVGCLNGHVDSLNLSNNNIMAEIHSHGFIYMNWLTTLKIDHNNIYNYSTYPISDFSNLTNLTELDLSYTGLTGPFPPSVTGLTNLTSINIEGSKLCLPTHDIYQSWWESVPNRQGAKYCAEDTFVDCSRIGRITETECEALTQIYNLNAGDAWLYNQNWFFSNDPDQWAGITLASTPPTTYVYQLNFSNNNLNGVIPPSISDFPQLVNLYLDNNPISGTLPPEIGRLSKLKILKVNNSNLSGMLPLEMMNLTNLDTLDISGTNLCVPPDTNFQNWLQTVRSKKVTTICTEDAFTGCAEVSDMPESECEALESLYNSTLGSGWVNKTNWFKNDTPCTWFGINCFKGHVQSIVLSDNNLRGSLPSELGDLTYLTELSLDHNAITGNIPPEIGSLTRLKKLSFWINQMEGEIPPELANLVQLTHLDLDENQFSGSIPAYLGQMSQLTDLWLSGNLFTGAIPPEIGNLLQLTGLGLYGNQLSGSIPPELGNLTNLTTLYLSENPLAGSIPSELGNLVNLEILRLNDTNLTGSVPASFGNLVSLQKLILYSSALSGSLPTELINLKNLQVFSFVQTGLCMPSDTVFQNWIDGIPEKYVTTTCSTAAFTTCSYAAGLPKSECDALIALYNSTKGPAWYDNTLWLKNNTPCSWQGVGCENGHVNTLVLSDNNLSGTIPAAIGNLTHLTVLYLNHNSLAGTLPSTIGNLSELRYLWLSSNQLSGNIPPAIGALTNLSHLFLDSNRFYGSIPAEIGGLQKIEQLWLVGNNLSGGIPAQIGGLRTLTVLGLGDNQLTGQIPSTINSLNNITILHLGNNLLSGPLPPELWNLITLKELYLYRNRFTGTLPYELKNLIHLQKLYLYSNELEGQLTVSIGNLTELTELYLDDNYLWNLPLEIGNLRNLVELGLSYNKFSNLPGTLRNLTHLRELWLNNNEYSSLTFGYGTQTELRILSLANNSISGKITPNLGLLKNLQALFLENNPNLEGEIPDSFVNLVDLTTLHLGNTDVCIPNNSAIQEWIQGVYDFQGTKMCPQSSSIDYLSPSIRMISRTTQSFYDIKVYGSDFRSNSLVIWDGHLVYPRFINPNELTVDIKAEGLLASPRQIPVTVLTPGMDQEESNTVFFTVSAISPYYGQKLTSRRVTFDWDDVPGADQYEISLYRAYRVGDYYYSDDPYVARVTSSEYAFNTDLINNSIYWWDVMVKFGDHWTYDGYIESSFFYSMNPPSAPTITDPANGIFTKDNTPYLTWNSVINAKKYQVQISTSSTFTTAVFDGILAEGVTSYTTDVLADGKYYWRVRGIDEVNVNGVWSAARYFTVDTVASGIPKLYTPKDGAYTADTTPALTVTAVTGAKNYTYQLSSAEDFSAVVWEKSGGTSLSASVQPYGVYWWRAKAVDAAGNSSEWSGGRNLTLTFQSAPAAGAIITDTTPAFTWTAVGGAKSYELRVYRQDEMELIYTKTLGLVTSHTIPTANALPIGKYEWQMSVNLSSGTLSTPLRALTVKPLPPAAPGMTAPANGLATQDTTPTFTWTGVTGAVSYELWLDNNSTFTSPEYQNTFAAEMLEVTLESELPDGKYYWRMRTGTVMDVNGPWSAACDFTVDTVAPGIPKLYTPKDGAPTTDTTPALTVTAVSGAKNYTYQLSSTDDFSAGVWEKNGGTSLSASVQPYGVYWWRAKAVDAAGNQSDWCVARRLEITFQSAPKAGWYSTDSTPTFTWTAVSGAKGYELRVYREGESEPVYIKALGLVTSHTIPAASALTPPGHYRWSMSVRLTSGTKETSERAFTLTDAYLPAPVLSSPASGTAQQDRTPEFVWNAVADAVGYELWVDNTSTFTSREFSATTAETTVTPIEELADGVYSWKVRAIDDLGVPGVWSSVRTVRVDNIAPNTPKLYTPASNASVAGTPKFTWLAASGAKYYQFQITSATETPVVVQSPDTLTVLSYKPAALEPGSYTWQVRAGDAAGNWSSWSTARRITIKIGTPAAPGLVSPANGSSTDDLTPELSWNGVVYGSYYQVQISKRSDFATLVKSQTLEPGVMLYTTPELTVGTYYWRVRARNASFTGAWSSAWKLIIIAAP